MSFINDPDPEIASGYKFRYSNPCENCGVQLEKKYLVASPIVISNIKHLCNKCEHDIISIKRGE